jgi:hypothetical protein
MYHKSSGGKKIDTKKKPMKKDGKKKKSIMGKYKS